MKKVMTVLGPVSPEEIGTTMIHEHLIVDLSCNFIEPVEASLRALRHAPVTMELLGLLRRRPFSVTLNNVIQGDEELAIDELGYYWQEGGQTVAECTSMGIGRDPRALYRISRATNVNVVMGCGVYTENAHPDFIREMTADDLAAMMVRDLTVGVDGTGIRSGFIGEIGTSGVGKGNSAKKGDITPEEEKVLRAAGRAAARTGACVNVHVDRRGHGAFRVIDILEDEGVPPDRMIMGHMDLVAEVDYHREVARRGVYLAYDSMGREYQCAELDFWGILDDWRVSALNQLIDEGFVDQIVLAQDICLKIDFRRYGGHGYAHVMANVLPMMRKSGMPEEAIYKMLVANPRQLLTVDWDEELLQPDVRQRRSERVPV